MSNEWKIARLGDVLKRQPKSTIKAGCGEKTGKYKFFTSSSEQTKYIDVNNYNQKAIILGTGGNANIHYCEEPFSTSTDCFVYFAQNNVNIEAIYRYLSGNIHILQSGFKGAGLKHISKSYIEDITLPLPSFEKQQEIAAVLDKASELVEKRKAELAELDTLAESIFYDMFGDPVTNEKGWETDCLKRLTTKIGSGATPKGGNESYKDEGISLIRSLNVYNGVFKYKDLAHIDDTQAAALNNVTIESDDILLNVTGASVARCCIVPSEILPARVNQHVAIVRVIKERLHYRFLCSQLISVQYQRKLLNVGKSNGATREALTKTNVEDLKVILPPLQLQQQFSQRIEKIEEQKQKVKAALKESEDLFQRLMQDMFNPEYHSS